VAAASYEARKLGALGHAVRHGKTAVSRSDLREAALRDLQGGLPAIRDIFAEHTPIIEPLSLDEAYST
jgi:DNA polymerase-4